MEPVATASASIGALVSAVCAVMAEVGVVQKTGKNQHGRYSYASELDLLAALQPSMAKHGLAMMLVSADAVDSRATGKAETMVLRCTYRLAHTSGEWIAIQAIGTGMNGDKAEYAAMTGAYKYALRQTFAVPTGDDPDQDQRGRGPGPTPQQAAAAAPTGQADERRKLAALGERIRAIGPYEDVRTVLRELAQTGDVATLSAVVQRLESDKDATAEAVAQWIQEARG